MSYRELKSLYTETITLEEPTGFDRFNQPTGYGTPQRFKARIAEKNARVVNEQGLEVVSDTTIHIYGVTTATTQWRITLPDGKQPQIITIRRLPDERGKKHDTIYTGQQRMAT